MLMYLTDGRSLKREEVTEEDCERAWDIAEQVRDLALTWLKNAATKAMVCSVERRYSPAISSSA